MPQMVHAYLRKADSTAPGTARARLSSIEQDRMGDILEPTGAQLDDYWGNPVLLYDHGMDPLVARRPVGTMTSIDVSDRDLVGQWRWSQSPEGRDIRQRWEAGELNAVSIGFQPLAVEPLADGRGWRYTKWTLLETSVVAIPACQSCLAIRCMCG
jgi:HK97 family phage prohead protease